MDDECDDDSLVAILAVNNVNQVPAGDVIWVKPKINGHTLKMELDTDSAISTLYGGFKGTSINQTYFFASLSFEFEFEFDIAFELEFEFDFAFEFEFEFAEFEFEFG